MAEVTNNDIHFDLVELGPYYIYNEQATYYFQSDTIGVEFNTSSYGYGIAWLINGSSGVHVPYGVGSDVEVEIYQFAGGGRHENV